MISDSKLGVGDMLLLVYHFVLVLCTWIDGLESKWYKGEIKT